LFSSQGMDTKAKTVSERWLENTSDTGSTFAFPSNND